MMALILALAAGSASPLDQMLAICEPEAAQFMQPDTSWRHPSEVLRRTDQLRRAQISRRDALARRAGMDPSQRAQLDKVCDAMALSYLRGRTDELTGN